MQNPEDIWNKRSPSNFVWLQNKVTISCFLESQGRGKCTQCPVAGDANESTRLGSKIHRKLWPYGARRPDSARRSSACAWNGWAGVGSTCAPAATRTSGRERGATALGERSPRAGPPLTPRTPGRRSGTTHTRPGVESQRPPAKSTS